MDDERARLATSPDGSRIAACGSTGVTTYDSISLEAVGRLKFFNSAFSGPRWCPDGSGFDVVVRGKRGDRRVVRVSRNGRRSRVEPNAYVVDSIPTATSNVRTFDTDVDFARTVLNENGATIVALTERPLAVSSDGSTLVVAEWPDAATISTADGRSTKRYVGDRCGYLGYRAPAYAAAISRDGSVVVAYGSDEFWWAAVASGEGPFAGLYRTGSTYERIVSMQLSDDGSRCVETSVRRDLYRATLWNLSERRIERDLIWSRVVPSFAFADGGRSIVVAGAPLTKTDARFESEIALDEARPYLDPRLPREVVFEISRYLTKGGIRP